MIAQYEANDIQSGSRKFNLSYSMLNCDCISKCQTDSSQNLECKQSFDTVINGKSYLQSGLAEVITMMIMTESYGRTSLIKTHEAAER